MNIALEDTQVPISSNMIIEAIISDKFSEDYSNYQKDYLYSRIVKFRDKNDIKTVLEQVKVTFTSEFEDLALKLTLRKYGLEESKHSNLTEKTLEQLLEEHKNTNYIMKNMFVYDYFEMERFFWDNLESETKLTIDAFSQIVNKDKTKNNNLYRLATPSLIALINEYLPEMDDTVLKQRLTRFLSLPEPQQDLLVHNIYN